MTAALAGCGDLPPIRLQLGSGSGPERSFEGLVAADESEAVLVGRNILLANGNAVDAAVALGFALAVTLPSSAGLGGGGACLIHDAERGVTEAIDFPAMPRGLFALHAKYGRVPWPQVVAPAENLARFGHTVSRAFAGDIAADGAALMNDRTALTTFMTPGRQMLQAGDVFKQIDLATTLSNLRARGPGDVGRVPRWVAAAVRDEGATRRFFLPEGGANPQEDARAGATGLVVADAGGSAVACVLSMGRPFGLGIMPPGTGFLLAPSTDDLGPETIKPVLTPVIGINRADNSLVLATTSAGGLINMLTCAANENTVPACQARNDPRGAGYAVRLWPDD